MGRLKSYILAVSWAMPPMITPRSINVSRTLKVLNGMGWEIDVVAGQLPAAEASAFHYDSALAATYTEAYRMHNVSYGAAKKTSWGVLQRLAVRSRKNITWEGAATAAAIKLIKERRPDVLITFAQPFSDHVIGLALKEYCPYLPWVAHCSDPWVDNPYMKPTDLDSFHEKAMLLQSAAVIFTTLRTVNLVMKKYPMHMNTKVHVVPHGFEEASFVSHRMLPPTESLRILHTGGVYGERLPWALLDALVILRDEGVKNLEIRCIGPVAEAFKAAVRTEGLETMIVFEPPTSPDSCREAAEDAQILLLFDAPAVESVFLPSKLVDYLAIGLPIFALTPENGASADVLREVNGVIASPSDPINIADTLRDLIARSRAGQLSGLVPNSVAAKRYAITETTRIFDTILRKAIQGKS